MYRYFVKDRYGRNYESFVRERDALDYVKELRKLYKAAKDYYYIEWKEA